MKTNLSKMAKTLGISRPTLYKKIEEDGLEYWTLRAEETNILNFLGLHKRLSPEELDSVLEWLYDNGCLSSRGVKFKRKFWEYLIKEL
jgi:DNA-binding XRE family transcriptional regulator